MIFMLLAQTAGGVWWASQLSAKIDRALETLQEYKIERYTREDARRDFESMKLRATEHDRRLDANEHRLELIETQVFRREPR